MSLVIYEGEDRNIMCLLDEFEVFWLLEVCKIIEVVLESIVCEIV